MVFGHFGAPRIRFEHPRWLSDRKKKKSIFLTSDQKFFDIFSHPPLQLKNRYFWPKKNAGVYWPPKTNFGVGICLKLIGKKVAGVVKKKVWKSAILAIFGVHLILRTQYLDKMKSFYRDTGHDGHHFWPKSRWNVDACNFFVRGRIVAKKSALKRVDLVLSNALNIFTFRTETKKLRPKRLRKNRRKRVFEKGVHRLQMPLIFSFRYKKWIFLVPLKEQGPLFQMHQKFPLFATERKNVKHLTFGYFWVKSRFKGFIYRGNFRSKIRPNFKSALNVLKYLPGHKYVKSRPLGGLYLDKTFSSS